uniref:Uncharacterized protein n=1 Tax=Romanomermis culicivorax TaxID=13658 RepID=A0A915KV07_ROMCU
MVNFIFPEKKLMEEKRVKGEHQLLQFFETIVFLANLETKTL